jgi:hypothetical protein
MVRTENSGNGDDTTPAGTMVKSMAVEVGRDNPPAKLPDGKR